MSREFIGDVADFWLPHPTRLLRLLPDAFGHLRAAAITVGVGATLLVAAGFLFWPAARSDSPVVFYRGAAGSPSIVSTITGSEIRVGQPFNMGTDLEFVAPYNGAKLTDLVFTGPLPNGVKLVGSEIDLNTGLPFSRGWPAPGYRPGIHAVSLPGFHGKGFGSFGSGIISYTASARGLYYFTFPTLSGVAYTKRGGKRSFKETFPLAFEMCVGYSYARCSSLIQTALNQKT